MRIYNLKRYLDIIKVMNECEYCEKNFSTKSNLTHHQKTAKLCLEKQNIISDFKCIECLKTFNSKYNLERHKKTCNYNLVLPYKIENNSLKIENNGLKIQDDDLKIEINGLKIEINGLKIENNILKNNQKKYEKQIEDLQNKLERIATEGVKKFSKNVNTINNNQKVINNLIPLTDDHIKEQVQYFSKEHIKKGHVGYVDYFMDYALNNRIICSDFGRRVIEHIDENGNIVKDPKLFESIKDKNIELSNQYKDELKASYDSETFMKLMVEIGKCISMVNRGADGEKTDLCHNIIEDICSRSIPLKEKKTLIT